MHRQKLIKLLQNYKPWDEEEAIAKEEILNFVQNHPRCFDKNEPHHLTGSAWLVNYNNSKFLLTLHRKLGFWTQLGGHVEVGETDMLRTALREAREESGLKNIVCLHPEIFAIAVYKYPSKEGLHLHFDINYLLQATDPSESIKVSNESLALKWFDELPACPEGCDVAIEKRMYSKWNQLNF